MTLFVDASFCPDTGAAGFGSWAIRDGWLRGRMHSAPLETRTPLLSSNAAEIAGIGMALWHHHLSGDLAGLDSINIQCDNLAALGYIRRGITRSKRVGKQAFSDLGWKHDELIGRVISTIDKLLVDIPSVTLKHVKGHSRKDNGRSWVNHHCDRLAKSQMLIARNRLSGLQSR